MKASERLAALKRTMKKRGVRLMIVPVSDPHLNEYVLPNWRVLEALSGFTGSAGMLIVDAEEGAESALITDSRYWEQAEKELSEGSVLIRQERSYLDHVAEWCGDKRGVLAYMPELMSLSQAEKLEGFAADGCLEGVRPLSTEDELPLSEFWPDRPEADLHAIRLMPRPGRSAEEKLEAVRAAMREENAECVLLSCLDDIAWMTNLRSRDIPCNPVFCSTFIVTMDRAVLLVERSRLDEAAQSALSGLGIEVRDPAELAQTIESCCAGKRVMLDPDRTNSRIARWIPPECQVRGMTPAFKLKSMKSPGELACIEEAHLRDAVALAEFYAELDERLAAGEPLTESDAVDMLYAWRSKDPAFIESSFDTIAAYGPNAAMPHYTPPQKGGAELLPGNLLLIDSGGQYDCGTTDITRMTAVGDVSDEMRSDVVLATRGMLRLLNLKFPAGATGVQVDAAARMEMWSVGIDFGHGTGHGVGYCLNVHEGPVSISPRAKPLPIEVGNVLSNEPGIYRSGRWGVRVENLMVCEAWQTTEFGEFLGFRGLTMLPIDVRIFKGHFGKDVELLNAFNTERREKLMPLVSERARKWLEAAAAPLPH